MKTAGIICEYNPFHTGHARQVSLLRQGGAAVVCLMSGSFTQRGEPAVTGGYTRAEAALRCGVDLVLELPYPYSAASAEFFAAAGVCILDAVGVDEINFGSESADPERLRRAAELTCGSAFEAAYRKIMEDNPTLGAAQAYFETYRAFGGGEPPEPNDILGVSYFRAALRSRCDVPLTVIGRDGCAYNSETASDGKHPSARALRALLATGRCDEALSYMPSAAAAVMRAAVARGELPAELSRLEAAVLSFFRLCEPERLRGIAEAGGGLAERLCAAARESRGLDEFFAAAGAKRYTDARVRRAVLYCMTGVTPDDLRRPPAFVRLLAANGVGRKILSGMRRAGGIPILTKPADAGALGASAARQSELSARADALFTLSLPKIRPAGEYLRKAPFIDFSEND